MLRPSACRYCLCEPRWRTSTKPSRAKIAATSRGFGTAEFGKVGELIVQTLDGLAADGESGNAAVEGHVRDAVAELTRRFPIY